MKKTKTVVVLSVLVIISAISGYVYARRIPLVDINRASVIRFRQLPEVSSELAEEIVRYREAVNFFDSIEELLDVPGVTEEIFEEISDFLIITPPEFLRADEIIEDLEVMEEEEEDYFEEMDVDIERLERYRANPLDLNTAALSQLMDLPLVTRRIAEEIIALRRALRGFTHPRDIRELAGENIFTMISPFIDVLDEQEVERFHGDTRIESEITYPFREAYFDEDERHHHPLQLYLRQRIYYGNRMELGIRMRRRTQPHYEDTDASGELSYRNITRPYLGNHYLLMRNINVFDTVVLGSYRLDYFRQATRTRQLRGLREDDRTFFNTGFYGAAAEMRTGPVELTGFVSSKNLPVENLNPDSSVNIHFASQWGLYGSRDYPVYEPEGYLGEDVYGGIVRYNLTGDLILSGGGYFLGYDNIIDHNRGDRIFRGDKINVMDLEAEYRYRNLRFIADWGLAGYHTFDQLYDGEGYRMWGDEGRHWYWDQGQALRLTAVSDHADASFWGSYWKVDYDYYDYIGEGVTHHPMRNRELYSIGGQGYVRDNLRLRFDFEHQEITKFYHGDHKRGFFINWRHAWEPLDTLWIRYSGRIRVRNQRDGIGFAGVYMDETTTRHTLQVDHRVSSDLRLRWVYREEKEVYDELGYLRDLDTVDGNYGELRYRPVPNLLFTGRVTLHSEGTGLRLRPVISLSRDAEFWMEYEHKPRDIYSPHTTGSSGSKFALRYTMSW